MTFADRLHIELLSVEVIPCDVSPPRASTLSSAKVLPSRLLQWPLPNTLSNTLEVI